MVASHSQISFAYAGWQKTEKVVVWLCYTNKLHRLSSNKSCFCVVHHLIQLPVLKSKLLYGLCVCMELSVLSLPISTNPMCFYKAKLIVHVTINQFFHITPHHSGGTKSRCVCVSVWTRPGSFFCQHKNKKVVWIHETKLVPWATIATLHHTLPCALVSILYSNVLVCSNWKLK